jgi:Ca2+-binding EF-hand superfamily protein
MQQFELTLDIERLIREADYDGSGWIDYREFKTIMT